MKRKLWAPLAATLLLAIMGGVLLDTIARKSLTNDEIVHIPAGYAYLTEGDFTLNNEHPPLVKAWAALPLLAIGPEIPPPPIVAPALSDSDPAARTWSYVGRFWPAVQAHYVTACFWTRATMVPITLALGWLVFAACRRRFGDLAGVFAVGLFCLEPTVLAHGRIVHTDVAAALAYFLTWERLWAYLRRPDAKRSLLLGAAAGLALAIKFSLLVLPVILLVAFVVRWWNAPGSDTSRQPLAAHGLMAVAAMLLVVNASYAFQRPALLPADRRWAEGQGPGLARLVTASIEPLSSILPTYFSFGAWRVWLHDRSGHASSFLGRYGSRGWWDYFPIAFALKTTFAFLAITACALSWGVWRAFRHRDRHFTELLVPLAVYTALAMSSHINIGIRHFLPVYPFLFVLGGAALARLWCFRIRPLGVSLTVVVLAGAFAAVARGFPDYIPYMNELTGGRPGWRFLSDSNVEWGDDAGQLATFLHARGETTIVGAVAGAWGTMARYGIFYREIFPRPGVMIPATRYVAIGASFLNGSTNAAYPDEDGRRISETDRINFLDVYRDRRPVAVFGKTIFLYEGASELPTPARQK